MSTIKVTNIQNPSAASPAIVLAADGSATAQVSSLNGGPLSGTRNRIINGDMRIDQRNGGAAVTPSSDAYSVDRWQYFASQASKFTVQQNAGSVTPPPGFTNYLGITTASAVTIGTSDYFGIRQHIEGFNFSDLGFGSVNAQPFTLSFWVRSSLTGTHGGAVKNNASNRSYAFSYSINSANTWEQKTITIPGDTTGTWLTGNSLGLTVGFGLGVGSSLSGASGSWAAANFLSSTGATSVVGTNGATFYITGVQLEAGTVATPFERRSYGQELVLCLRYYEADTYYMQGNNTSASANIGSTVIFSTKMRTSPTVTTNSTVGGVLGLASTSTGRFSFFASQNGAGEVLFTWTASAEL